MVQFLLLMKKKYNTFSSKLQEFLKVTFGEDFDASKVKFQGG